MPDLLLELRSEEIPARMQRKAAGDLKALVTNALVEAGLTYEGAREYWTPRRLTLDVRGVDARSRDTVEERKGPRTDAPEKAIEGFLRGSGLASIEEAETRSDPKKGDFYVAVIRRPGRAAEDILAEAMPAIVRDFPWPKAMRWGPASAEPGALRWVRPLQSILCTFGPETEEPVVVDFEVGGLRSSNVTCGHRFHAPEPFTVRRFDDYADKLEKAFVVLDAERRKEIIRHDAENLAFARGLEVVPDEGLLEEVCGLVEWPVTLTGSFDEAFLSIPPEMVQLTIRTNQKCFVTRPIGSGDGATTLSSDFLLVANIEARDGGAEIARGNGKVVRARLSDALYFWQTDQADLPDVAALAPHAEAFGLDLSKPLDQRMARLDALGVTFHARLGTQGERVKRIAALAEEIAGAIGDQVKVRIGGEDAERSETATAEFKRQVRRAAVLAKADLVTEAVGEFPELQGLMGRYYAGLQGEHPSVQTAIEEHYKPLGPADRVPTDPVAIVVALADKLDMLAGFWAIDEKPTGSKDPYALRRAALGVIRILIERQASLKLTQTLIAPLVSIVLQFQYEGAAPYISSAELLADVGLIEPDALKTVIDRLIGQSGHEAVAEKGAQVAWEASRGLLAFFHERLKTQLRDQGARHDLVDAVLSGRSDGSSKAESRSDAIRNDDLLDVARRVEVLGAFLATEDGANLLAGTRRAANILAAEEKKGTRIADAVDPALLAEAEERSLADAIDRAEGELEGALGSADYARAMTVLAALRPPVDAFFDAVLVNADEEAVRANRLALLAKIRAATQRVADFGRIAG